MANSNYTGGTYAEVRALCNDGNDRVAVIIPALALILDQAERKKGEPLTEAEVLTIRDRAPAIQMDRADFIQWSGGRAPDLDPDIAWAQWRFRQQSSGQLLGKKPGSSHTRG